MELKTKYQYTYFIYPYIVEENKYADYLYSLLKKKQCKLKLWNRKKDTAIDSYFLPEIKEEMFWSLDLNQQALKDYESMDHKMKANLLSKKPCCFFEYHLKEDVPGKIGEKNGIFFDITKVEIICFSTGLCFLLMKTALTENSPFTDVLNFNYKFRDIQSAVAPSKEYESIKIQTNKLNNMQSFAEFIKQIAGTNQIAKKMNLDTNKLITYAYVCLDQSDWNENTNIKMIEKEFEKYRNIKPASEQVNDITYPSDNVYKEKYAYYAFSNNSTMLLTSDINVNHYTKLPFQYENEYLYHYIYLLHKKNYLKKLTYDFRQTKNFESVKRRFLNFAKRDWIYEVTSDDFGVILEQYYRKEQNLDDTFLKLKNEYDLLYKEYEIGKSNKHNTWIIAIIGIMLIFNIINLFMIFGK